MENQNTIKPAILSSCFVSIIMSVTGLSGLFWGLIYLVGAANADPINLDTKSGILREGEFVAFLTFLYFIICLLSVIYWYKRRQFSNHIILGLGLLHLAGSYFLMVSPDWQSDLASLFFKSSLIMNLLLIAVIFFSRGKLKSRTQKSNV